MHLELCPRPAAIPNPLAKQRQAFFQVSSWFGEQAMSAEEEGTRLVQQLLDALRQRSDVTGGAVALPLQHRRKYITLIAHISTAILHM